MRSVCVVAAAGVVACIGLAGCGGGSDGATSNDVSTEVFGTGPVLEVAADPDGALAFTEDTLEVASGDVVVNFTNEARLPHDFCIRDGEGVDLVCSDIIVGSTTTFTQPLAAGEYLYYCSLAGHRQNGMEGTLTVTD